MGGQFTILGDDGPTNTRTIAIARHFSVVGGQLLAVTETGGMTIGQVCRPLFESNLFYDVRNLARSLTTGRLTWAWVFALTTGRSFLGFFRVWRYRWVF